MDEKKKDAVDYFNWLMREVSSLSCDVNKMKGKLYIIEKILIVLISTNLGLIATLLGVLLSQ